MFPKPTRQLKNKHVPNMTTALRISMFQHKQVFPIQTCFQYKQVLRVWDRSRINAEMTAASETVKCCFRKTHFKEGRHRDTSNPMLALLSGSWDTFIWLIFMLHSHAIRMIVNTSFLVGNLTWVALERESHIRALYGQFPTRNLVFTIIPIARECTIKDRIDVSFAAVIPTILCGWAK